MLLHDARRDARIDARGEIVLLEEQDRTRWDRAQIAEGLAHSEAAIRGNAEWTVRDSVGDCGGALARRTRRYDGLARDRGALRTTGVDSSVTGDRAESSSRSRDGRRSRGRPRIDRRDSSQRRAARLLPDVVRAGGFAAAAGTMERGGGVVSRGVVASGQRTRAAIYSAAARGDVGEDEAFIVLTAGQ